MPVGISSLISSNHAVFLWLVEEKVAYISLKSFTIFTEYSLFDKYRTQSIHFPIYGEMIKISWRLISDFCLFLLTKGKYCSIGFFCSLHILFILARLCWPSSNGSFCFPILEYTVLAMQIAVVMTSLFRCSLNSYKKQNAAERSN